MTPAEHRAALDEIAKQSEVKPDGRTRKRFDAIAENLDPDEMTLDLLTGLVRNRFGKSTIGVAVLTDRRILYMGSSTMTSASESFPLDRVDAVQMSQGRLFASLTITVLDTRFRIGRTNKKDTERFGALAKEAIRDW